jgi:hypothetical protein
LAIQEKIKILLEKKVFDKTTNLGYLLFLILILVISINAVYKPTYNWDMIGYIGAVYSINETNVQKIHDKTYTAVKLTVPDSVYKNLTGNEPLRIKAHTDPVYFNSLLNFYKIKPLYVWLIYLLQTAGFNIVFATVIPSFFSYFLLMIVLYNWISRLLPVYQTLAVSSIIAVIRPISELAKFSTPDLLSSLILLYALYLLAIKKDDLINMPILFALSVLSRPDNLVFWFMLLITFFMTNKNSGKEKKYFAAAILSIVIAFILFVLLFDKNLGWVKSYTGIIYQTAYWSNLKFLFSEFRGSLLFYSICASFLLITINGLKPYAERMHHLFLACFLFIAAKLFLYPYFEERYYIAVSMFFIIFIIYSISEIKSTHQKK